ncbi:hypothetical protein M8J76_014991 [Diaphorina citri]|nr:hypothetical protein M8J75_004143 [Diaphorina citri]KAI5745864.1 hypothetical protein M8J76_014991 [Diaphorina citri]
MFVSAHIGFHYSVSSQNKSYSLMFNRFNHLDSTMNQKSHPIDMVFVLYNMLGQIKNCLNIHNLWGFKFFFNKINQDGY